MVSGVSTQVMVPPLRPAPPGALWLADAAMVLVSGWRLASRALHVASARRSVARAARRRARDRAALIALACSLQATQPSFASDLYHAATRDGD